jgi:hypothetical protein
MTSAELFLLCAQSCIEVRANNLLVVCEWIVGIVNKVTLFCFFTGFRFQLRLFFSCKCSQSIQ